MVTTGEIVGIVCSGCFGCFLLYILKKCYCDKDDSNAESFCRMNLQAAVCCNKGQTVQIHPFSNPVDNKGNATHTGSDHIQRTACFLQFCCQCKTNRKEEKPEVQSSQGEQRPQTAEHLQNAEPNRRENAEPPPSKENTSSKKAAPSPSKKNTSREKTVLPPVTKNTSNNHFREYLGKPLSSIETRNSFKFQNAVHSSSKETTSDVKKLPKKALTYYGHGYDTARGDMAYS